MDLLASRRTLLRNLFFAELPAVPDPGASTLVCVFLRGAADTLNMLVPYGDDDYYRNRPTLSIRHPRSGGKDAAEKLDDFYALHPALRQLAPLYAEGRLGFVQAVGSDNPSGSHFETQDQIEHGEAYGRNLGGGWLGRHLRARAAGNAAASGPLAAIALGATLPESLRGAPTASAFTSIDEVQLPHSAGDSRVVARALSALYSTEVGILGAQGTQTLKLLDRVEKLRGKPYAPAGGATYPKDEFGSALREVARIVKADLGLEVACIDINGWDTHFFQGTTGGAQAGALDTLGKGLAAFDADLKGYRRNVTTIVMTEFGRRLYENGSAGTDHGRGFAFFAIGDRVAGGKVHGDWPGLAEEPTLPGPGGMEIKIDYRSVLSDVLTHATSSTRLSDVFPGFIPQKVGLFRSA